VCLMSPFSMFSLHIVCYLKDLLLTYIGGLQSTPWRIPHTSDIDERAT